MAVPLPAVCRHAVRITHRTQWLSYRLTRDSVRSWSTTAVRSADGPKKAAKSRQRRPPAQEGKAEDVMYLDESFFGLDHMDEVDAKPPANSSEIPPPSTAGEGAEDIPHFNQRFFNTLYSDEKDAYLAATGNERLEYETTRAEAMGRTDPDSDFGRDVEALIEESVTDTRDEFGPDLNTNRPERPVDDFSTMGDPDRDIAPDEEWADDDMSSNAHGELDMHREMREYARLAAWEMPLLANLAVPFKPPTESTPLRWRYTSYMGAHHPAANKVVLTFKPTALALTPAQTLKMVKLAGPRYDPHKEEIKMSAEHFPSPAQNKRYLGDTFASLLREAKTDKGDSLADIPLDFRHARHRREKLVFPIEWRLTPQRRAQLERSRAEKLVGGSAGGGAGSQALLDGVDIIDQARLAAAHTVPAPAAAPERSQATSRRR